MLTLTEAVIIRTANDRQHETVRQYEHALQALRIQLRNEKAARLSERTAYEVTLNAAREEIALLREIACDALS